MISTARVPADRPVRIAFSLDHAPDGAPPEDPSPLAFPELDQQLQSTLLSFSRCRLVTCQRNRKELVAKLAQAEKEKGDAAQLAREFEALTEENRTLKLAQSQCVEQLEKLRIQYQKRQGSS
ncbi:PREDICTED: MAP3K7 C-terminal-like protein [Miniopterus natalensis]|uniref:MAP3K7 C-terminal-like protein n=1 Tax=Miniopterus natalensis TaxID=291302 RepID=UPI0007A6FADC|nr:PREDICTED: MAP3K7 C-terminal-like protein [Miniopterus natalensis]